VIITVTLNAAVDRAVILERMIVGETNRTKSSRTDPGGKGINVSRVIRELGYDSLAMGFIAGPTGRFIEAALNEEGIFDDFIHVAGRTRTNMHILDESTREQTRINEPGPSIDHRHMMEMQRRLRRRLTPDSWVVLAGSIPPGLPPDAYVDLLKIAHDHNMYTVLDADGPALEHGLRAKPYLIKPNLRELEMLVGHTLADDGEVLAAARELHEEGVKIVTVSLAERGALAVSEEGVWRVVPPEVKTDSTVGAGDSFVAGVVASLSAGESLREALILGTAAGSATAMTPGTELCHLEDVQRLLPQVQISKLE
jgi:1-phosphofructokinase